MTTAGPADPAGPADTAGPAGSATSADGPEEFAEDPYRVIRRLEGSLRLERRYAQRATRELHRAMVADSTSRSTETLKRVRQRARDAEQRARRAERRLARAEAETAALRRRAERAEGELETLRTSPVLRAGHAVAAVVPDRVRQGVRRRLAKTRGR